ncbi:YwiC-like family protein [Arcanobacterium canis]
MTSEPTRTPENGRPQNRLRKKVSVFPNQKGAWAMATLPFVVGAIGGSPSWQHLVIFAVWIFGYCLFYCVERWYLARKQPKFLPSIYFWLVITATAGIFAFLIAGALLPWVIGFVPFAGLSFWAVTHGQSRTLLARTSEVLATSLMCLVAWETSLRAADHTLSLWHLDHPLLPALIRADVGTRALVCSAAIGFYLWSTVPFVKSLLRERGNIFYSYLTIASHVIGLTLATALWASGWNAGALVALWILLSGRMAFFFWNSTKSRIPLRKLTMTLGFSEIVLSLLYATAVLQLG